MWARWGVPRGGTPREVVPGRWVPWGRWEVPPWEVPLCVCAPVVGLMAHCPPGKCRLTPTKVSYQGEPNSAESDPAESYAGFTGKVHP